MSMILARWRHQFALLVLLTVIGCRDAAPPPPPNDSPGNKTQQGSNESGNERAGKAESPKDSTQASASVPSLKEVPQLLSPQRIRQGWLMLFDGRTLFGWQRVGKATWRVEDGMIVGDGEQGGFLRTTTPFCDYELELEFRAPDSTNSGVFLHTQARPRSPATACYELNIAPADNPFPTGSFVRRLRVDEEARKSALAKVNDGWHRYHVLVRGATVIVDLNGVRVLEYTDPSPLQRGYIALQQNTGPISFRNIFLRPLGLSPIFNGKNLTGWRTHPDLKGTFGVTDDGELHVQGGRGQLESEATFADFVLQLEAKTGGADMNSGVFFRCIPGDVMMGYESQIHNGFVDGDRTRPTDCGTGGIFRRQHARIVAADDKQWFGKTIIADGRHFAVWVNGLQVTDWTDSREPDPNPRRGFRAEAGSIMLQAHDPTTDVLFRNLRAREMAARGNK